MADKRVTPARADLAAAHLKGEVDAPRYAEGEMSSIGVGRASLRTRPSDDAAQDSELLLGERFTVYDRANGWAWGQAAGDLYVGYVHETVLCAPFDAQGKVTALLAPVFAAADLKTPVRDLLPMNASVPVMSRAGDYVQIAEGGWLHAKHLEPVPPTTDFVSVAERFMGVPYVWGGKTAAGLDCSGLVQTALQAVGKAAPRDTDMQEQALGDKVVGRLQRGDLVFWKGHVGVMVDESHLLHANAYHMMVAVEPLADAVTRITAGGNSVTSIRRL